MHYNADMKIRECREEDISAVLAIMDDAKEYLHNKGIPQWQNGYPNRDSIESDMQENGAWVIDDVGEVLGYCFIKIVRDPQYTYIENGEWLNDEEYAVLHRTCVKADRKGQNLTGLFVKKAEEMCRAAGERNLRADTHDDNLSMRRCLEKNGFKACGRVYMADRGPRIGYQKVMK